MNKKYFILFFIVFELMQIADLILTYYGLKIPGNQELNPFYSRAWFIPLKLFIPLMITVLLYYVQYFRIQARLIMGLNILIYAGILGNNIIMLGF